jgi:hypothetical protein
MHQWRVLVNGHVGAGVGDTGEEEDAEAYYLAEDGHGARGAGFSSMLAGVRPKNKHTASPGGQYMMSPTSTSSRASGFPSTEREAGK